MEEEFQMEVVDKLGGIELRMRQTFVDTAHLARAAELQNFLLQQLVVALGGVGLHLVSWQKRGSWCWRMKRTNRTRQMSRRRVQKKSWERSWKQSSPLQDKKKILLYYTMIQLQFDFVFSGHIK